MRSFKSRIGLFIFGALSFTLFSCSTYHSSENDSSQYASNESSNPPPPDYASRIPQRIATNQRTVVVDPRAHVWGAYDSDGQLIKSGLASAGSSWCSDLGRPCRTRVGTFHVYSLGNEDCKSHIFPIPRGGAPMPYCMFFNNGQALHGVPANEVGEGNYSHGCVRLHVSDAEWLRYNFVDVGTKVIVRPY